MSDINLVGRTDVRVTLNNVDISEDINDHLVSVTFTDLEDGASDDLEIVLEDSKNTIIGVWLNAEMERRGKSVGTVKQYKCPYVEPSDIVKHGSQGEGVKWLQWHLNNVCAASFEENGYFSIGMIESLKKFQRTLGFVETGICDYWEREAFKEKLVKVNTTIAGKGSSIGLWITQRNYDNKGSDLSLNCGSFELDDVGMSGPPQQVTMKGTSCSYASGIRTEKHSRTWNNVYLENVAQTIANDSGYVLLYLANVQVHYSSTSQNGVTDIVFLQGLCSNAGLSLKVTNNTLVIFDQNTYEKAEPKREVIYGDGTYSTYNFDTKLSKTAYSACNVKYTNTKGKKIDATFVPAGGKKNSKTLLKITDVAVETKEEAMVVAQAKLREANKGETSASFVFPGDLSLCAGTNISLVNFGGFDGIYTIEESRHTVSRTGYITTTKLRKVITEY